MSTPVIGPKGERMVFDGSPEDWSAAQKEGWRLDDGSGPTVVESVKSAAAEAAPVVNALGLGALQGATAGGYGTLVGATQPHETKAAVLKAMEESPIATGVGEFAGMVASPLNKLAPAIEGTRAVSAIGRVGQKALSGGAIGSLYGAGQTVSDASLGDTQLTAERLVTGIGLGAVLGGLGGGVGGAIEEGAAKVLPKLGTVIKGGQSALDDVADHFAIRGLRATQTELGKIPEAELPGIASTLRGRGHLELSAKDALKSIAADRQATADTLVKQLGLDVSIPAHAPRDEVLGVITKALDEKYGPAVNAALRKADANGARPAFSGFMARLDQLEGGLNEAERDIIGRDLKKVRGYLEEMGSRPAGQKNGFEALNNIKSTLTQDINYGGDSGARNQLKQRLLGVFRDEIDTQLSKQRWVASKEFLDAKRAYGILSEGADALGRLTSNGADAVAAMAAKAGIQTPEAGLFRSLNHAHNLAESGAARAGGFGLRDILAGDVIGHVHGPFGIASAIGAKFIREHGAAVAAQIADKLAKSPALNAVAHSFATALPATAPQLGRYGPSLLLAAERSPALALAQHIVTAQADPEYAANAQMAGLTPEAPDQHAAAIGKATDIAAIHAAMQSHDEAIHDALQHVVKGTKPAATPSVLKTQEFGARQLRRDSKAAHTHLVERIRELATNPNALVDLVSSNTQALGFAAPNVSAHMVGIADRAVKYLAQQAEVPPKPGPLAREWAPTDSERHSFALKLEAVQSPMSVLKRAAEGRLVPASLDAVRAVYPQFAEHIADKALEQLASGERMSYRARLMLSMLTGISADGTTSPAAVAANQEAIMRAGGKPSEKMGAASEGGPKLGQAERMASPDRRRELEKQA